MLRKILNFDSFWIVLNVFFVTTTIKYLYKFYFWDSIISDHCSILYSLLCGLLAVISLLLKNYAFNQNKRNYFSTFIISSLLCIFIFFLLKKIDWLELSTVVNTIISFFISFLAVEWLHVIYQIFNLNKQTITGSPDDDKFIFKSNIALLMNNASGSTDPSASGSSNSNAGGSTNPNTSGDSNPSSPANFRTPDSKNDILNQVGIYDFNSLKLLGRLTGPEHEMAAYLRRDIKAQTKIDSEILANIFVGMQQSGYANVDTSTGSVSNIQWILNTKDKINKLNDKNDRLMTFMERIDNAGTRKMDTIQVTKSLSLVVQEGISKINPYPEQEVRNLGEMKRINVRAALYLGATSLSIYKEELLAMDQELQKAQKTYVEKNT